MSRPVRSSHMTGGPNEVWSFGQEAYAQIRAVLELRERLRPYLDAQMAVAHQRGVPPMRPLFVDFPGDARSWAVEDEFLLGPDLLVAPVLDAGARCRNVYLPPGSWSDAWSGAICEGAHEISVDAPWTGSRCSCAPVPMSRWRDEWRRPPRYRDDSTACRARRSAPSTPARCPRPAGRMKPRAWCSDRPGYPATDR